MMRGHLSHMGFAESASFGRKQGVSRRFIDWIWHIKGSLALAPGLSREEAFHRLNPLFQQPGTSYEKAGNMLTFRKKGQAPQDRMSIFDSGVLEIKGGADGGALHYRLSSRALLFCFLAPFLFLALAGATIVIAEYSRPSPEAAAKAKLEKEKEENKILPQNPIDKALGAPAPEKPKKDDKKKADDDYEGKPSPTPAYVFAGIFLVLYIVGRILEDRLIKALFRKRLLNSD